MISNYTGTDAPTNITTDQQITLDNSAHVDNFFAITYSQNQDVDAVYVGFDDLFFRYYPGTGMIRAFGPYDHTTRGWYLNAKQYTSPDALSRSLYVISDPYKDAAGKGWMVTFSTVVTNSSAGNVVCYIIIIILSVNSELWWLFDRPLIDWGRRCWPPHRNSPIESRTSQQR